jgi:peptidyl-prolyl cis-trans isomerase C
VRRIVAIVLMLSACQPEPPPPAVPGAFEAKGPTVATVDGKPISQEMVDAVTRRFPDDQVAQIKADPDQYKQLLDRVMLGQGLYQRALDQGLDKQPGLDAVFAMANREILASELLEKVANEAVTDEKIQAAYDKHKVQYAKPAAKIHHMLVDDEAQANDIVAQLKAGADFGALATQYSKDGAPNGGDLGWVDRGRLITEVDTAAFAGNKGDIVGPVHSAHGFHIMKIDDKRDMTPLEEVRSELVEGVKQEAVNDYLEQLKGEMKIEYTATTPPTGDTPTDAPATPPAAPAGGDGSASAPPAGGN